jgi:hypothetical protein
MKKAKIFTVVLIVLLFLSFLAAFSAGLYAPGGPLTTVASYTTMSNTWTAGVGGSGSGGQAIDGMFFQTSSVYNITEASWYLKTASSNSRNVYVELYTSTSSYALTVGQTPVAVSNPIPLSSFTSSFAWYNFSFPGGYVMSPGYYFCGVNGTNLGNYEITLDAQKSANVPDGMLFYGPYTWYTGASEYDGFLYKVYGVPLVTDSVTSSGLAVSSTTAGAPATFSCAWTGVPGLGQYVFGCNVTGSWVNQTATSFTTDPQTVTATATLPAFGSHVSWEFWADDSALHAWSNTGLQTFTVTGFWITASADSHSTITPSGKIDLVPGSTQTFMFAAPSSSYSINSVLINGQPASIGAGITALGGVYTFRNVQANATIAVTSGTYVSAPTIQSATVVNSTLNMVTSTPATVDSQDAAFYSSNHFASQNKNYFLDGYWYTFYCSKAGGVAISQEYYAFSSNGQTWIVKTVPGTYDNILSAESFSVVSGNGNFFVCWCNYSYPQGGKVVYEQLVPNTLGVLSASNQAVVASDSNVNNLYIITNIFLDGNSQPWVCFVEETASISFLYVTHSTQPAVYGWAGAGGIFPYMLTSYPYNITASTLTDASMVSYSTGEVQWLFADWGGFICSDLFTTSSMESTFTVHVQNMNYLAQYDLINVGGRIFYMDTQSSPGPQILLEFNKTALVRVTDSDFPWWSSYQLAYDQALNCLLIMGSNTQTAYNPLNIEVETYNLATNTFSQQYVVAANSLYFGGSVDEWNEAVQLSQLPNSNGQFLLTWIYNCSTSSAWNAIGNEVNPEMALLIQPQQPVSNTTYSGSWTSGPAPTSSPQSSSFQVQNLILGTVAPGKTVQAQVKVASTVSATINVELVTFSDPFNEWATSISSVSFTGGSGSIPVTFNVPSNAAGLYNGTVTVQATSAQGTYTSTADVTANVATSSPSSLPPVNGTIDFLVIVTVMSIVIVGCVSILNSKAWKNRKH